MTLVILAILILAYILIATENITKVNRAAVAIFAGTVGWVLYICFGMDFVTSEHSSDYSRYLNLGMWNEIESTSTTVKYFIARNIFLPYVGRAAEIVLFLLATMTIVEILNNSESILTPHTPVSQHKAGSNIVIFFILTSPCLIKFK